MARRAPAVATTRIDFLLGVLVSLGVGLLIITIGCELTGQPALLWALLTGAVAVTVGLLYRRRGRIAAGAARR
jgi:hypothetical protein